MKYFLSILIAFTVFSCNASIDKNTKPRATTQKTIDTNDTKLLQKVVDIELPEGFKRLKSTDSGFATFLQNVALKKDKTVYLFNGQKKANQLAQFAVLNISVGSKDLQQCADAVMRLKAEYLFQLKKYNEIVFWDNQKKEYRFGAPFTRENFDNYLLKVFGMCGSASLEMQLKNKNDLQSVMPGDVFIKGGFPGHAVIVIDVAENEKGERIFMIAQSYMPAQNIHILRNPNNENINPWYAVNEIGEYLFTPEYTFTKKQLKTW